MTNVGIGSSAPSVKLDVIGNTKLVGTLSVDQTATFEGNIDAKQN